MWQMYRNRFNDGIDLGYHEGINHFNPDHAAKLKQNVAQFSAYKEAAFKKDLKSLLGGNRADFNAKAKELNKLYNEAWLNTEYHHTVAAANMSSRWAGFESRKHLYPNLRYIAVKDGRTRPEHAKWHGTILPMDHPFWDTHLPPNDWGCRCNVSQTDKPVTEVPSGAAKDTFANNPGKTGKVFVNSGYEQRLSESERKQAGVFGKPTESIKTGNIDLVDFIKKEIPTNAEIKAIFSTYAKAFPEDFRNGLSTVKEAKAKSYMMRHSMHYSPRTGEWVGESNITISSHTFGNGFNPLDELKGALAAIKKGSDLTFNQEYALESLWHEILHAKTKSSPIKLRDYQIKSMETINQFVARHTYPDFISKLGGKAVNQAAILDRGYGYGEWISDFRKSLAASNISEKSAVEFFTPHLMKDYSTLGTKIREFLNPRE